jgi:hypothetical protein
MATLQDSIDQGEAALQQLYQLQTQAMKAGDLTTQKALGDDINDLTYKLTQLKNEQIADDDASIDKINAQLSKVVEAAKAAQGDFSKVSDVLGAVISAAKVIDSVLGVVAAV